MILRSMLLVIVLATGLAQFFTPAPTPIPLQTARPFQEYENYTTSCSHVKCERQRGGYIKVYHSKFEEYGHKHVCAHGLHKSGKCGCECYDEGEGEESNWEQLLSPLALDIIQNSSSSFCKVKKYGACWFLGKPGQSCRTTCDWRKRAFVPNVYPPATNPVTRYLLGRRPYYTRNPRFVQECYVKNPLNPKKDQYFPALEGGYGSEIPAEGWEAGTGYSDARSEIQDFSSQSCQLACPCNLREHEAKDTFRGGKKSCTEWFDNGYTNDGEYLICPAPGNCFHVHCDMTNEGGGWTLVMSRGDVGFGFKKPYSISAMPDTEGKADIIRPMEGSGKVLASKQWASLKQLSVEFAFHIEGGSCGANGTTYRRIHHGCIHGHDYKIIPDISVKQCEAHCSADPKCRAFEYGLHRLTLHPTATPTKIPTAAIPTLAPTQGVACDPVDIHFANASDPAHATVEEQALMTKVRKFMGGYAKQAGMKNGRPFYKLQAHEQYNNAADGDIYLYSFFRTVEFRNVWLVAANPDADANFQAPFSNQGYAQSKSDAYEPADISSLWDYFDADKNGGELVSDPDHELQLNVTCQIPRTPAPTPMMWTKAPTATPTISPTWSKPNDCRLQDSTDHDGCYGMKPVSLDLYIKEEGYSFGDMPVDSHCVANNEVTTEVTDQDLCHDFALDTQKDGESWNAISFRQFDECTATQNVSCTFGSFGLEAVNKVNGTCIPSPHDPTGGHVYVQVGETAGEILIQYSQAVMIDTLSTVIHPDAVDEDGLRQIQVSCEIDGVWTNRGTFVVGDSYYGALSHFKTFTKTFPQCRTDKIKLHGIHPRSATVGFTTLHEVQLKYGDQNCANAGGQCTVYKDCTETENTEAVGYSMDKQYRTCGASQFTADDLLASHVAGKVHNMTGDHISSMNLVECADLCNELQNCTYFAYGNSKCRIYKDCNNAIETIGTNVYKRTCAWSRAIANAVLDCASLPPAGACQEAWWSSQSGGYTLGECQTWCESTPNCTGISYGAFKQHCRLGIHGSHSPAAGVAFWKLWGSSGEVDCDVTSICSANYYNSYSYRKDEAKCDVPHTRTYESLKQLPKGAWAVGKIQNMESDAPNTCASLSNDLTKCNLVQSARSGADKQCSVDGDDFSAAFGIGDALSPTGYTNTERCTYFSNKGNLWDQGAECATSGTYAAKADLYVRSRIPHSCKEYYDYGRKRSGQYLVCPVSVNTCFDVYCDMEHEGGGWTLVMSRSDVQKDPNATLPHHTNFYIPPGIADGSALTEARWADLKSISTEFAFQVSGNDILTGSNCNAEWGRGLLQTLNSTSSCSHIGDDLTVCDLVHTEQNGCSYQGGDYSSIFGKDGSGVYTNNRCTYFSHRDIALYTGAACITNMGFYAETADLYVR